MGKTGYKIADFQAKFGVSIPLYVQGFWRESVATIKRWWRPNTYKDVIRKGDVLKASTVEVSPSADGGEFDIRVVYRKVGGTWAMVMPIWDSWVLQTRSPEETTIRFSDRYIRGKLETELGKLPPVRGNFVCSCCAIDTGDQSWCSGCGATAYWAENGGGCRLSCEMVMEME